MLSKLGKILEDSGFTDVRFFIEEVPWLKDAAYPHYVTVAVRR